MNCRRIGKLLGTLLLALLLSGCRIRPELKPDIIVDIPLNPTEAVTIPVTESLPPETEPVTEAGTELPTEAETEAPPPVFTEHGVTDPPPTETRMVKETDLAQRVADAVNAQRQNAGMEPLALDAALCARADQRALEQTVFAGHTRPDGSGWQTVLGSHSYGFTAELLYFGIETAVADRWMRTDAQRQDLLSGDAAVMGAAAYTAGDLIYVVVILAG